MKSLKGTRTHENLRTAFAAESQATLRYLHYARAADIEGEPDLAGLFRNTSEAEIAHAFGHLDQVRRAGDPTTGLPFGSTRENLLAAVESETGESTEMYPGMAKIAREEGFPEIADWFETLAKAERSHAGRFSKALSELDQR
jgi:rubrerythrin